MTLEQKRGRPRIRLAKPHPLIEFLVRERKALGRTQRSQAFRVHVADNTYTNWELGTHLPSIPDLIAMGNALGYHLEWVRNE